MEHNTGTIALVGGDEFSDGCSFDGELLKAARPEEIALLPTAAAFESPKLAIARATQYFGALGFPVRALPIYSRTDASDAELAGEVAEARFLYLTGGSPLHLRSVLKDSATLEAIKQVLRRGGTLVASSASAMVLANPMIDPRGGALTLGLGLFPGIAILPHANTWNPDRKERTLALAGHTAVIVAIDERTALIRSPGGSLRVSGEGTVTTYRDRGPAALEELNFSVAL